jgi:hypothetical protein
MLCLHAIFTEKAFIHPNLDHVGKGDSQMISDVCPNTDCLRHNLSTEVMLLVVASSLWCIQAEQWMNFKDITVLAQERQAACTDYLVREATRSQLHSSNSREDMGFLLSSSRYPAMNVKHCSKRPKGPMTSNKNSDGQLKPMWSTMGQDISNHLTPLCPPFPAWSRLGWTKALCMNILYDHNTSVLERQWHSPKLQTQVHIDTADRSRRIHCIYSYLTRIYICLPGIWWVNTKHC